jgi:hypothetical protein
MVAFAHAKIMLTTKKTKPPQIKGGKKQWKVLCPKAPLESICICIG